MPITIEDARKHIERVYIGFSPSTHSVKPAHIANGLFRTVAAATVSTRMLNRFVISQTHNGQVPKGHELESVYEDLSNDGRIDSSSIRAAELSKLRAMTRKVVAADGAVYTDGMDSYSAGYIGFLSRDRIAQDGGEFISGWLRHQSSPLGICIKRAIEQNDDTISLLCAPVLDVEEQGHTPQFDVEELQLFAGEISSQARDLWNGLNDAASTLSVHLDAHPNKLYRLRLSVLFAAFVLARHLSILEITYNPEDRTVITPFLVEFTDKRNDAVPRASSMTYMYCCQSIARFYAWAFGCYLASQFSIGDLLDEPCPTYKRRSQPAMAEIWELAKDRVNTTGSQSFTTFGQALYDMMALEAEGNPITYLRQLGIRSGFLVPPVNLHPSKRFRVHQDMLEMLIRGAVSPGETIDMPSLQDRLWSRYGIIIGGRPQDEELLRNSGVYQIDSDALEDNRQEFARALQSLDFARLLADGVLQIEMEEHRAS